MASWRLAVCWGTQRCESSLLSLPQCEAALYVTKRELEDATRRENMKIRSVDVIEREFASSSARKLRHQEVEEDLEIAGFVFFLFCDTASFTLREAPRSTLKFRFKSEG